MDLKARKLELVQNILDTEEEGILEQIKLIFEASKQDWWDTTSPHNQRVIQEGVNQLDRGEGISNDEVKKQIKKKFTKHTSLYYRQKSSIIELVAFIDNRTDPQQVKL